MEEVQELTGLSQTQLLQLLSKKCTVVFISM